ncbi:MAG: ATP-binding protein [Thiohalobacterales bacterium]
MTYTKLSIFYSLRFRLIASVVAIEVVMLSLLVWSNIRIIQTTHTDRLQDTANSLIQQIANTSGNYMVAVDYASLRDYLENVIKHQELSYLVILDRDERPVVSLGKMPDTRWPEVDLHPSRVADGIFDSAHAIQVAGEPMGRVLMGFSLSLMQDAINKSRIRGISIAVTEIILTVLATVLIGLHLTRRLGILAQAAGEVGKGNYSVAVPIETADEVGKTAIAFNRMVAEVSGRTQQLELEEERSRGLLAENRQLIRASLEVQEEERKYLARELHDELGQCITAIQADARSIRDLSSSCDPRVNISADAIMSVSTRIYEAVHSMMQRLRPGILDDLGLVEALREAVNDWQGRNPGIRCTFEYAGDLAGLGERVNITVYRIIQECLTNITKYASATRVAVSLVNSSGSLSLEVADDGQGGKQPPSGAGLGLIGMRERVEALGGEFRLETAPGDGYRFTITIPVTAQESADT